jgi:hypothetical protein
MEPLHTLAPVKIAQMKLKAVVVLLTKGTL